MSMNERKELVAEWVLQCDDRISEIVQLLDKAYPIGAEERFNDDWDDAIGETLEEQSLMDEYRDKGVSPSDFH